MDSLCLPLSYRGVMFNSVVSGFGNQFRLLRVVILSFVEELYIILRLCKNYFKDVIFREKFLVLTLRVVSGNSRVPNLR